MTATYNPFLVALSLLVAILASYTVLELSESIRVLRANGRTPFAWLVGGATVVGAGIWSMHFVGMLAFSLPMPLGYDWRITGSSLLVAAFVSYFALYTVTRDELSRGRGLLGGVLMGLGISAMHYTGMAAMRMQPGIQYNPWLVAASIGMAIAASWMALRIASALQNLQRYRFGKRMLAACIMGLAIAGMHYIGMASAHFSAGSVCHVATAMSTHWLAPGVTIATLVVLGVTLVLLEMRLERHSTKLSRSLEQANERLLRWATHDPLTELPNRASLQEGIERAIEVARREGDQFMLLFMDIDGFKTINDSLGHSVGDQVLKAFACQLVACVRREDLVARLGGDEFVVLLQGLNAIEDAARIAEDILAHMQHGIIVDGAPLRVTPSIGVAVFPQDGENTETLLKNADAAMYAAKQAGRNTYCFFEAEMSEAAARTLRIQRGLTEALEHNHLSLRFQPQFCGSDQNMSTAEALLRWHSPQMGEIPPLDFIPIAERSGQITQIGNWVIREVCRHIRQWDDAGLPKIKIAINLSPQQLRQQNYVETVIAILNETSVPPERILFEITETVAMQDAESTEKIIRNFQALGFDIAIDDFGTGYSSLSYLQQFQVKQLKIDRFFTRGLDRNGDKGYAIVAAIIALAHALDMHVVAEGVETESQLAKLQMLACDQVQGFLLGKPLRSGDFESLLRSRSHGLSAAAAMS
jgi:diguanylate cyclase (GGDEF)-like protein